MERFPRRPENRPRSVARQPVWCGVKQSEGTAYVCEGNHYPLLAVGSWPDSSVVPRGVSAGRGWGCSARFFLILEALGGFERRWVALHMRASLLKTPWSARLFQVEIRPWGARHSGATKIFVARWGFSCEMGLAGDISPQSNSCWVVSTMGVGMAVDCVRRMLQTTLRVLAFPSNLSTLTSRPSSQPPALSSILEPESNTPSLQNAYNPHPSHSHSHPTQHLPRTTISHGRFTRSGRTYTVARNQSCICMPATTTSQHLTSPHLTCHASIDSHL